MRVARSVAELTVARHDLDLDETPPKVVYVATMGALHAGHRSLIRLARTLGDVVVVSIFVNPLQFGPDEDYARYPRPIEDDLEVCRLEDVDLVFVPTVADLYPAGRQVSVSAGAMGAVLEGASRPAHFDGVLTVVMKLLHLIRPQIAIFGRKDAQQLACIQRMVVDLNLPVEIVGAPIVRESDGLALSSRNVFLNAGERQLALHLSTAVQRAAAEHTVSDARTAARQVLARAAEDPVFALDYVSVVNPATFAEVADDYAGPAVLVVAATVGRTRLIDNGELDLALPAAES